VQATPISVLRNKTNSNLGLRPSAGRGRRVAQLRRSQLTKDCAGRCSRPLFRARRAPYVERMAPLPGCAEPLFGEIFFERVLLPHRSLPPFGVRVLMLLLFVV